MRPHVFALSVSLLATALVLPAPPASAAGTSIGFGFSLEVHQDGERSEVEMAQEDVGLKLHYGSFWATDANRNGWGSIREWLQDAVRQNVTPMVQWYYWGDIISDSCVRNNDPNNANCKHRTHDEWFRLARELADVLVQELGTQRTAIVVLETEFHKGAMDDSAYLNDRFVEQAAIFHAKPNLKVALGFGHWCPTSTKCDDYGETVAVVDYLGTMILHSCYQESLAEYRDATQLIIRNAQTLRGYYGTSKPIIVDDFGLSSYSGQNSKYPCQNSGNYETEQENEIKDLFNNMQTLKDNGVFAIVFRSLDDTRGHNPDKDHHRAAEAYWGFRWKKSDGTFGLKPAYNDVVDGIRAENQNGGAAPPPGSGGGTTPPPVVSPGAISVEAENFDSRPVGGLELDTTYSGGKGWEIWSNGGIEEYLTMYDTQAYLVTIRADGDPGGTALPHMLLRVNGALVAEWDVTPDVLRSYTTRAVLPAGAVTLRIEFNNDFSGGGQDRDLKVDVVHLEALPRGEWSVEGESMTWTAGSASVDAAASAGAAWNANANGHGEATFTARITAPYEVHVVAKGDPLGTVWPFMEAYVDGVWVGNWSVDSDGYKTYVAKGVQLSAGAHTLRVRYTNDASTSTDDRNLFVDAARLVMTPSVWTQEVESFTSKDNGQASDRSFASAGYEWNLWGNGSVDTTLTVPKTGEYVLRVVARGESAVGVWPVMRAYVGATLVREWTVDSATQQTYVATVNLAAGSHALSLEFPNDLLTSTEDRNLRIDLAALWLAGERAWSKEAETFTCTAGGLDTDAAASGGQAWNLWSNGRCDATITTAYSGPQTLTIRARGDVAGGVWPVMRVVVDGVQVAQISVTSATWKAYEFDVTMRTGSHSLQVHFTNDGTTSTQDRNLRLDAASVWA